MFDNPQRNETWFHGIWWISWFGMTPTNIVVDTESNMVIQTFKFLLYFKMDISSIKTAKNMETTTISGRQKKSEESYNLLESTVGMSIDWRYPFISKFTWMMLKIFDLTFQVQGILLICCPCVETTRLLFSTFFFSKILPKNDTSAKADANVTESFAPFLIRISHDIHVSKYIFYLALKQLK